MSPHETGASVEVEMKRRVATIDLAPWPYDARPRVLIEHPDPDEALELATAIRREGATVGICRGPQAADKPTRCPLHRLEPCVVVEGADVVVTVVDLATEDGADVLRGLRTRYPSTPLVVVATVTQSMELDELLDGCTVMPVDASPLDFARAVRNALPEREG